MPSEYQDPNTVGVDRLHRDIRFLHIMGIIKVEVDIYLF